MDKYLILKDNVVANVVIADEAEASKHGWIPCPSGTTVSKGWRLDNGVWLEPLLDIEAIKAAFAQEATVLLLASNDLVAPDLWESYSQVEKDNISTYRASLRAVPNVLESEEFNHETYELPMLSVN